jgi:hypothetical protein
VVWLDLAGAGCGAEDAAAGDIGRCPVNGVSREGDGDAAAR